MASLAELAFSRQYNREHYGVDRGETIQAKFAPSANAMLSEWWRLSGVIPGIRYPVGGARTQAQCNSLGTPWYISDHYQAAANRAAVDIDNRGAIIAGIAAKQGLTFSAATKRYYDVAAKYGYHNITTDGRPFPTEPWHLAIHSSSPAGYGTTPLPGQVTPPKPTPEEIENRDIMTDAMYQAATNTAGDDITADNAPRTPAVNVTDAAGAVLHAVKPLSIYYQEKPGAPLRLISEGAVYNKNASKTVGKDDFARDAVSKLELAGFTGNEGNVINTRIDTLAGLIKKRGLTQ